MNLAELVLEDAELTPYHSGKPSRVSQVPPEERPFIAWDGEGVNLHGPNAPQSYTLFGCSTGDYITGDRHLHTFDLLDFILRVGADNRAAFHVGFAFNYDANMIVRSLSEPALKKLHETGTLTLRRDARKYHVQFMPGKWFSVTRYGANYDRKKNPHDKVSVKIYDIFSFFGCSFIKAYTDLVGPVPSVVSEGKANRNTFSSLTSEYVLTYWRAEITMLRELAEELRRRMYGANLRITQWHGPGALANYANKKNNVRNHMAECPEPVREAARYGYAGGRFEMFRLGRTTGPVYSLDINSAYPYGITQLPSLAVGEWRYIRSPSVSKLARFGVYRVRLLPNAVRTFLPRAAGPLFHRDKMGNISFPWLTDSWYWSPEVRNLRYLKSEQYEIVEGWEYVGWQDAPKPFRWVEDMYNLRRRWKDEGNASQLALKLCMNSLYGKMAQRVGWNVEKRTAPTWHQLEWAGWVTSNTRAMLWRLMAHIPRKHLIAVETDGLYTTYPPEKLGIEHSSELGGWEIDSYDEIMYVQSGLAWLRKGDEWICKRRGLDARTFELSDCMDYLRSLQPGQEWAPFIGRTTRFIGLGAAFQSSVPFKIRHCVWQTVDREIRPGQGGKRIHVPSQCRACKEGLSAYDAAHDMTIRSLAYAPGGMQSNPHDIPWEGEAPDYEWRHQPDIGEVIVGD